MAGDGVTVLGVVEAPPELESELEGELERGEGTVFENPPPGLEKERLPLENDFESGDV